MKTKSLIILIIVLILAGLVFGFVYWSKYIKPEAEVRQEIPSEIPPIVTSLEELKPVPPRGVIETTPRAVQGAPILKEIKQQ